LFPQTGGLCVEPAAREGVFYPKEMIPRMLKAVAEGCCGRKFRNMAIEIVDIPIRNGDFP